LEFQAVAEKTAQKFWEWATFHAAPCRFCCDW